MGNALYACKVHVRGSASSLIRSRLRLQASHRAAITWPMERVLITPMGTPQSNGSIDNKTYEH